MKKATGKRVFTGVLAAFLSLQAPVQFPLSSGMAWGLESFAAATSHVQASTLNVREGAGTGFRRIGSLRNGTSVSILEELRGSDGTTWAKIRFQGGIGYVQRSYLGAAAVYTHDGTFEAQLAQEGFPESYKVKLREIHAEYPNWIFRAYHTGVDWEEAIKNEGVIGRNLVHTSVRSSWKSLETGAFDWENNRWPGFDSNSWVAASWGILRYYMDPRNFLNSSYVFAFLKQSYDAATQTAEGVETLASGTFLAGKSSGSMAPSSVPSSGGTSGTAWEPQRGGEQVSLSPPPGETAPGTQAAPSGGAESQASRGTSAENSSDGSGASRLIGVISGAPQGAVSDDSLRKIKASQGSSAAAEEGRDSAPSVSGATQNLRYAKPEGGRLTVRSRAVIGHSTGSYLGDPTADQADSSGNAASASTSVSRESVNYIDLILEAARVSGVSPYVLTSMILQEQGNKGSSGLISGTSPNYPGIYNFFNVQAYADGTMNAVTRGLWWASQPGSYGRPWDSVQKAVVGGAQYYGENFIGAGQDTFYLKKFNVTSKNRYRHQYMTNVQGAASEGFKLGEAYSQGLKQSALVFSIPIFQGMPETPAEAPAGDGNPNNKLRALTIDGFRLTPSFDRDTDHYDLIVDPSVGSLQIRAETIDEKARTEGDGTFTLSGDQSTASIRVTAENGDGRSYTVTILRQSGGQSGSGNSGNGNSGNGDSGNRNSGNGDSGNGDNGNGEGGDRSRGSASGLGAAPAASDARVSLVGPSGNTN